MMMYVKWQDVGCEVNVELVACGQVIRGGRKAAVHRGEALSERRKDSVCVCIPTTTSTQDLFEFACPLLEVIIYLY